MKTVKFTIEFEEPERGEVLEFACPYCKAKPGDSCTVKSYDFSSVHPTNVLHHERIAETMNLERVGPFVYRIKP